MKKVKQEKKTFPITSTIFFVLFLGMSLSFFYILDSTTNSGFGIIEILFSIVSAILITLLAIWIKTMIRKNGFLGLFLALLATGSLTYGLYYRYNGPKTNIFAIAGAVIFLIYEGIYFVKYWKEK